MPNTVSGIEIRRIPALARDKRGRLMPNAGCGPIEERSPKSILPIASCRGLRLGLVAVWSFASPLALDVPRSRWFRFPFLLFRVRCWFWSSRVAVVSFVLNAGSRLVFVFTLRVLLWFWSCAVVSFHLRIIRPNVRKYRSRAHRGSCRTRF